MDDFLRIQLRWIPRKSPKFQDCGLTFLSSQTLKLYPLNHLSKWYDKGLTFSRITSLHLSTRFISKSGKIEWIFNRVKGGKINFVKCQISIWISETTNQLSVSLHFKFVLITSLHKNVIEDSKFTLFRNSRLERDESPRIYRYISLYR